MSATASPFLPPLRLALTVRALSACESVVSGRIWHPEAASAEFDPRRRLFDPRAVILAPTHTVWRNASIVLLTWALGRTRTVDVFTFDAVVRGVAALAVQYNSGFGLDPASQATAALDTQFCARRDGDDGPLVDPLLPGTLAALAPLKQSMDGAAQPVPPVPSAPLQVWRVIAAVLVSAAVAVGAVLV